MSLYLYVKVIVFFFVKQKTAYEMRISDWSSDVCSSDLLPLVESDARRPCRDGQQGTEQPRSAAQSCELVLSRRHRTGCVGGGRLSGRRLERSASVVWSFGPTRHTLQSRLRLHLSRGVIRCRQSDHRQKSEERRVGKGCVRTCRSRWS